MLNWIFGLKCPDCGERITEENEYCPGCGVNLNDSNRNVSKIHSDQNFENAGANLEDAKRGTQTELYQRENSRNDAFAKIIFLGMGISLVVVALADTYFLYTFARQLLGPKTAITFEPDFSQVTVVDRADVEKTAQLLTERSQFLGYSLVAFIATEDNKITAKVPNDVDTERFVKSIRAVGLLEFVDFGKTQFAEGTSVRTDMDHPYLMHVDGTEWHTVMTNTDIKSVEAVKNQFGVYEIQFTLTDRGREIFSQHTTENVGNHLGIVLDKVVISAPRIDGPIKEGLGVITGTFTKETAEELAMLLKMTPLPIPIRVAQ